MLNYRINRFFKTGENSKNFPIVVFMIENELTLCFKKAPTNFIDYLFQHNILKRNQNIPGGFLFTELGNKYLHFYNKNYIIT